MSGLKLTDSEQMAVNVVRELGTMTFSTLILMNAAGALVCFALGLMTGGFVVGLLVAFAGVLITYVMAALSVTDPSSLRQVSVTAHMLLMVGPPFVSLVAFILGVTHPMVLS